MISHPDRTTTRARITSNALRVRVGFRVASRRLQRGITSSFPSCSS
ncbi:hypothetical protein TI01_0613 [Lysobacter sp. A03]|nr:hypothetical protein TI01_0613 [Lysobacter sp. A03]